jgi:hypothetical protein
VVVHDKAGHEVVEVALAKVNVLDVGDEDLL